MVAQEVSGMQWPVNLAPLTKSRGCEEEEGEDVERGLHGGTALGQNSGGTRVCTAGYVVADRGEES